MKQCRACHEFFGNRGSTCNYCGSDFEASDYIAHEGLEPSDIYEELCGRKGFYRLTIIVARMAVSALRLTHPNPN